MIRHYLYFRKVLLGAIALAVGSAQTVGLLPPPMDYFTDNNGQPLAGGFVYTYASGTSSPLSSYTDYTGATPNSNPVVLNTAGRASIWLLNSSLYRIVVKNSSGVTIYTSDGISGIGASGTSGALWSLSGTTINNQVGTKVCVSSTACTTSLALFNAAGTSSGSNHLIRVDDTASNPGVDLYGSGSLLGSYTANSSGLQLRSGDGTSQLSIAQGNVMVLNAAASGGSTLNIKESATQGSVNPLQVQSSTGSNLMFVDPSGNGSFPGLAVSGTAVNSLQVPVGGVAAKWLVATDSLFLIEEPTPALSASGQARIYADATAHNIQVSQNGAAYAVLGGGGGGSTTFDLIGSGTNNSAKTMTVGSTSSLTFSGSGIVNASEINATTIPTSPAADMVLITTAAGVGAWSGATLNTTGLANCVDTGGNHLNYNTSTHVFSCGTTGGTAGSVAFGAVTTGTNTLPATMTLGNGSALTFSGTGTVNANLFNAGTAPASGSIWKSNGTLQPVAAGFADIVATFSGGSGCSGTNWLSANGTCQSGSGIFLPISGGTMTGSILFSAATDVGSSGAPPRNVWAGTSFTSLNSASNTVNIPNGGLLSFNATVGSLTNYMILQGTTPQINGASLGAAMNINGSASVNGNIILNPGAVSGLQSVQINGHAASTSTEPLIVNDNGGSLGAGVSIKHGGTFDAAWQAGSSTALDVVGNDGSTHRMIVLQTGQLLVGRTSDNGTGAILQAQGSISTTGGLIAPSGSAGITSTLACANISLTISGGIITAASCF